METGLLTHAAVHFAIHFSIMPRSKAAPNVGGSSAKQNDDQALMVECERNIEESSETVSFPSPSQSLGMSTSTPQKRTREDDDDDALFSSLEFEDQGNGQAVVMAAFTSAVAQFRFFIF